jgi:hypothetical protein
MIYGRNSHNGTYKTINCINVVCVVFEPLFFIAMYMFEIKKKWDVHYRNDYGQCTNRTNRVSMEESMGQDLLKIGLNSIST